MSGPSLKTIKTLFAKSGNRCAFPRCESPIIEGSGTVVGQICHINARNSKGPRYNSNMSAKEINDLGNLILLCANHHQVIDDNPAVYISDLLIEMKKIHESRYERELTPEDDIFAKILLNDYGNINITNNSGSIIINSPNAVQAGKVTIKTTKEKINVLPPEGTVSQDLKLKGYIIHLIKRYNEFAGKDSTRETKFSYGAIYRNIETHFGVKYDFVPITRANELIAYLQNRIDKTRLAHINRGKGNKSYSSYEEFVDEFFPDKS